MTRASELEMARSASPCALSSSFSMITGTVSIVIVSATPTRTVADPLTSVNACTAPVCGDVFMTNIAHVSAAISRAVTKLSTRPDY